MLVSSLGACNAQRGAGSSTCDCTCPSNAASTVGSASASTSSAPVASVASADAAEALEVAQEKFAAGDGKGCLAALDAFDVTSKHPSTNPISNSATLRAQCTIAAGECQKGKALLAKTYEARPAMFPNPEQREKFVETMIYTTCHNSADLTPRERLLQAYYDLQQGAYVTNKTVSECQNAYATAKTLAPTVSPKNDDDTQIKDMPKALYHVAANCFARAGDCPGAKKAFDDSYPKATLAGVKDPKAQHDVMKQSFESTVPKCKGAY